jgi:hypothetical protein
MITVLVAVFGTTLFLPKRAGAADFVVYSVYKALDMGNPGEVPQKDYYVNMGSSQGIHPGSIVKVYRRMATYDLLSEKLYKDITVPIGTLRVIASDANASVARLDKLVPDTQAPALTPRAPMIGDVVRFGD